MIIPSEDLEQITFVREFKKRWPNVLMWHTPNGGFRHKTTAEKMRLLGQLKGVPDIFIPEWFLLIEMKRIKGGSVSKDQKTVMSELNRIGYTAVVARGWEQAIRICEDIAKRYNGDIDKG